MSSFPSRAVEIWKSSHAERISPLSGVFSFEIVQTLMVPQTLQFLSEFALRAPQGLGEISSAFLKGMRYVDPGQPRLLYWKDFHGSEELFSFDPEIIFEAIRQLEIHADINLTFARVTYLADVGRGPEVPLWILARLPFARGVAFEIEERGAVAASMAVGDFCLTNKVRVAQQHYSTGMSLLAGEDSVGGLVDAAFMQFYLATEAVLGRHESDKALREGSVLFGAEFDENLRVIVKHVYLARHLFFGHAHPKFLKGILDTEVAFDIAKQTLVSRWCARRLLELELGRPLVKREMWLSAGPQQSVAFHGDSRSLASEFALPH